MSAPTPTSSLAFQNFFSATLTSDITSSATDIPMDTIPNGTEGFLVIEPDSTTAREVIYYNSKTATKVTCPSAALGRGQDDTTASSHLQGSAVIMAPVAAFYEALQSGSAQADSLLDKNGNEWVRKGATASAVNDVTITNAATGNAPTISATGDDTNISIGLAPKGTGTVNWGANSLATAMIVQTSAVPGANSDSTGAWADWGASVSITVPTWATKAYAITSIENFYAVTAGTVATARLVIGSNTGSTTGYLAAEDTSSTGRNRSFTWSDTVTLTATGSQTLKIQVVEIAGTGALRLDGTSRLSWFIIFG